MTNTTIKKDLWLTRRVREYHPRKNLVRIGEVGPVVAECMTGLNDSDNLWSDPVCNVKCLKRLNPIRTNE